MAVLTQQMASAENGTAYILADYETTNQNKVFRIRYANGSARPVLAFVNAPDGTELFRTTLQAGLAEQSVNVPTPMRWPIDSPTAPSVNLAS